MGLESPSRQLDNYVKCIFIIIYIDYPALYIYTYIHMASPLQSGILPFALYGLWIYDNYI